ncbi:MAG: hypothetical protein J0M19_04870 [Sphingomonadales bacterium]|nr:hypothetical protein [Sphingomonadales bacterium]
MYRSAVIAVVLTFAASTALAVPGGPIDTLLPASYVCEMPGDATAAAGYRVPGEDFSISNSTSYATPEGRGTYLLIGDRLTLTSGPKKGNKYHRISDSFLRKLGPDDEDTALRCVRRVLNNSGGASCAAAEGPQQAGCTPEAPLAAG